jgi:RND superfamily putative drug exporter
MRPRAGDPLRSSSGPGHRAGPTFFADPSFAGGHPPACTVLAVALRRARADGEADIVDCGSDTQIGLTVNGQSAGILLVLVFGAGTDYALLLVARYREELGRHDDAHEAARRALSRAAPAIAASAGTVVAALLVLLLARVNSTSGLGPIGALGVVLALVSALTLLPALLAATGRRTFWPLIPRVQGEGEDDAMRRGLWRRLGARLARRPRAVWTGGALILAILCTGVTSLDVGLPQDEQFRDRTEAVRGQDLIARAFPAGALAPATIVVGPGDAVEPVRSLPRDRPGIASLGDEVRRGPSGAVFDAVLKPDPYSAQAFTLVEELRDALDRAGMRDTLIGGQTATERDYRAAALRDDLVLPPLVLGVVFVILAVVLRALVLPIALIVSVILSYGAAFGVGTFMFAHVFGFAGLEPSLVLLSFIFLVGLGVDYNIFLMTRAREEVARHGQREGMLRSRDRDGDHVGRDRAGGHVRDAGGAAARRVDRDRVPGLLRRAARRADRALGDPARVRHRRGPAAVVAVALAPRRAPVG